MNNLNKIKKVTIEPYGGFGNNLQQIALAIMFSKKYKKNFVLKNHPVVKDFKLKFSESISDFTISSKKLRFFYFGSDELINHRIDPPLEMHDKDYYLENFSNIFKTYIKPQIIFLKDQQLSKNMLVIHIRNYEGHPDYAQNPISYYKHLNEKFDEILFVTDNPEAFILTELKKFMNYDIQSSTLENDFNTLYSAKNLASSGVGTFVIAAALMSENLINFYYSNLFLKRGLNPLMLSQDIDKTQLYFNEFLDFGKWKDLEKVKSFLSKEVSYTIKN